MSTDINKSRSSNAEINLSERDISRFWEKVDKSSDKNGCWVWNSSKNKIGYGTFSLKCKSVKAHRVAWTISYGQTPKGDGYHGMCVLHKCDNRACCRPDHLFLGTQQDNVKDMVCKGRNKTIPWMQHPRKLFPERTARGEKTASAKLTSAQVVEIRKLASERKMSRKKIGEIFGVGENAVSKIFHRQTWAHVP